MRLESVKCNICGSDKSKLFFKVDNFEYRKCENCGLVYQSPRPVFDDLKTNYKDNYFEYEISNQKNFFNLMKLGLKDINFDGIYGEKVKGSKKFLDIGCATGMLLNHMKQKGWNTKGVELCRESAEYGIKNYGLDISIGTLFDASFPDNYFDVVHLSHLIEHVPDPKALLIEIHRILKKDGHIILTTPNVDGWHARIVKNKWRSAIPEHVFLFSKKSMKTLLDITGFRILKQESWGGMPVDRRRPIFLKKPTDKLAKLLNVGDVMLFHCSPKVS